MTDNIKDLIEEARAAGEGATPKPWAVENVGLRYGTRCSVRQITGKFIAPVVFDMVLNRDDAKFAAYWRNHSDTILDALEEALGEVERLKGDKNGKDTQLSAKLEGGKLKIEIGLNILAFSTMLAEQSWPDGLVIADVEGFSGDLLDSLMDEDEDGTMSATCKTPLTDDELKVWEAETLQIILQVANTIVHQRECALIDQHVDWDPDSDPIDESRAAQRHERRRVLVGLPARGYRATRHLSQWSLFRVQSEEGRTQ